ncbi:YcxB family protein [Pseudomonas wadenswilerensis]|uniref:YcxB family protein n=1 Tax=Pseudomonas wadenswilerensis TaxID=1785161 RepID=UPI0021603712|nr:YcxB family protein [Pseudomonas wadenswilerensis]UVM24459.1 YcxB family protein [Pseudomonas wadenswilerensis]
MELHYSITPAHIQAWIAEPLKQEMLKHDQQQAQAMANVARWQRRLVGPLMFALCLVGGMLALYFPERRFTAQNVIAMVLFALIFIPLWWRFSGRWIKHLQARIAANHAKPRAPLRGLNQRLIETRLRAPLKSVESTYCLSFDDQGFTLDKARSGKSTLAWEQIARLQETPDFYLVAGADMVRQGVACLIAKHSDLMPAEEYQQGLQAFLSQCPVAPSAN